MFIQTKKGLFMKMLTSSYERRYFQGSKEGRESVKIQSYHHRQMIWNSRGHYYLFLTEVLTSSTLWAIYAAFKSHPLIHPIMLRVSQYGMQSWPSNFVENQSSGDLILEDVELNTWSSPLPTWGIDLQRHECSHTEPSWRWREMAHMKSILGKLAASMNIDSMFMTITLRRPSSSTYSWHEITPFYETGGAERDLGARQRENNMDSFYLFQLLFATALWKKVW